MRPYSLKLLTAAVIALSTVSSSKEYGFKMAQVDRPTAGPSHADNRTAIHDDRLPQANSATDSEERAPGPSKPVFLFGVELKETTPLFLENALTRQVESAQAHIRPNPVGDRPVSSLSEATKAHVGTHVEPVQFSFKGQDGIRVLAEQNPKFSTEKTTELRETLEPTVTEYMKANNVVGKFEEVRASPMMFHPDTVKLLMNAVEKWNAKHPDRRTFLLDALVVMFDDVANLAPALAKAKKIRFSKVDATRWQEEMLTHYINYKVKPRRVFDILELGTKSWTLENLDTFDVYLCLYQKKFNISWKKRKTTGLMAYLRNEFSLIEVIRRVKAGREHSQYPDEIPARLVESLKGDSENWIDEVDDLLGLSNQVSMGKFSPAARNAIRAFVKAHPDSLLDADVSLAQKLSAAEALKEPAPRRQRTG
ncbi:unnamed protein product [Hyaloperonospora brassicae]|uniref:RxLR effector candidate protein n=1 Tax=Hyaloperonospora brassicae TaxID=162125 RepID=A0AAV0UK39_HYABA|nr:unnamed protein product [Hyaloperonospora brassicae]